MISFILFIVYIAAMYTFFYITRKFKLFDNWVEFSDDRIPCYVTLSVIWPLGILAAIFTFLYNITK